jgi:endonuclease-3
LHGRYVCKARKPDCPVCAVADLCRYQAKTEPAEMPADLIKARAKAVAATPLVGGPGEAAPIKTPRAPRARR